MMERHKYPFDNENVIIFLLCSYVPEVFVQLLGPKQDMYFVSVPLIPIASSFVFFLTNSISAYQEIWFKYYAEYSCLP